MSTQDLYERPRSGIAQLAAAPAEDSEESFRPRIVPIAEGEITQGAGSQKRTEWDRDTLKRATEAGVFDHAKLVRGRAAVNPHLPMDEQLSPDDIVGDAGTFRYEEGKGPVSNEDGVIVDDHIAKLVENNLVEVSPDLLRSLGDWDESLAEGEGAHSVEEILAVPRMTILDRGAGQNAEIGPAEQEALAELPKYDDFAGEQLARSGDAVTWESDAGGSREPADSRYGVVVDGLQDEADSKLLVAVYQPDEDYEGWEARGEQNPMNEDSLEVVGNGGVESLPAVSDVIGSEQNGQSTMPAEPGADDGDETTMSDENKIEELREQLAAAEAEKTEQAEQIQQLQGDKEELEEETEELEEEKETLEEENETLKEDNETFRQALATKYAEASPMSAEAAMKRLTVDDMVEDLDEGPDGDDDDRSPKERLSEQLADGISLRGHGSEESGGNGGSIEFDEEQAEQLANSKMTMQDVKRVNSEGITKREYAKREWGVDPAEYGSKESFQTAVEEAS